MLALMRKHARNWLMQVLLGIIILVFIFYFGSIGGEIEKERVATIDDIVVTRTDFLNEHQNIINYYRQLYGEHLTADVLRALNPRQNAYDSVINQAVVLAKAAEFDFTVTDDEIQQTIFSHPAFQRDGIFDIDTYERALGFQGIQPDDYETLQRRVLTIEKVMRLITEAAKVSDSEAYDLYRLENQELNLSFIAIDPADFEQALDPSLEDLERFFARHREQFRVPRAVKVRYLRFSAADYADDQAITDAMVEEYYYANLNRFQIIGEDDDGRDRHKPLSMVREEIVEELRMMKGYDEAFRQAKRAHDTIYQTEDFSGYVETHALPVETTGFFSAGTIPDTLGRVEHLSRWAFELDVGETTPLLSDDDAHYLFLVVEEQPSYIPAVEEVAERVKRLWRSEESLNRARTKAEDLLDELIATGDTLESVAQKKTVPVQETGFFLPGDEVPLIGSTEELFQAIFELSEHNPLARKVFFIDGIYYLIQLTAKTPIDEADWKDQQETVRAMLMDVRKDRLFRSWLEETKASLSAAGRMAIHRTVDEL